MGAADLPCVAVEIEHRLVPRGEQVYGYEQTVADLADPAGSRLRRPIGLRQVVPHIWGFASTGHSPEGTLEGRPRMRFYNEPRAGSAVLIQDPLADDLVGSLAVTEKPESLDSVGLPRAARSTAGKSLVTFWRRWWRSL